MKKLGRKSVIVGVGLVILSIFGCQEDMILEPNITDAAVNEDTVKNDTVKSVSIVPSKATSNIINVKNPGNNNNILPNLKQAISIAKSGDIILLPEGYFAFYGTLIITKRISLKGNGIGKTVIYRPESTPDDSLVEKYMFFWKIDNDTSSNIVISDFTLKSKKPAGMDKLNGSLAKDYGIGMYKAVDFVITRCRFENFGTAGISVIHKDNLARGLIYNCEFYHNFKGDGLGLGYGVCVYGENLVWKKSVDFGSYNFIFIENNLFEYHRHSIAGGGCGLYVARYNIIRNNFILHAIDMHGGHGGTLGSPNYFSTRAIEAYNNVIENNKRADGTDRQSNDSAYMNLMSERAIGLCGGESVIHNNDISGYVKGIWIIAAWKSATKYTYPIDYQIGYGSGVDFGLNHTGSEVNKDNGDCFIWDNNFKYVRKSNPMNIDFHAYDDGSGLLKENRDYHLKPKPGYSTYNYPHPLRKNL